MNRKLYAFVLLFFFVSFTKVFAGDTLIHAGSSWKYLDNGSNQGTLWIQNAFNDSSWSAGNAEFGYGDSDETTVVSFGNDSNYKHITTYFRTYFNVANSASYNGLRLFLKRDDGLVLYLNGQEIYRSNMPSGTLDYDTKASWYIDPGSEEYFFLIRLDNSLVNGTNVLAAEVHQDSRDSEDMSFDLMMIGDSEAEIIRSPYLQTSTTTSMRVCYRTSVPDITKVYYGNSIAYSDSVVDTALVLEHAIDLTGLSPSTKYYYSVHSSNKQLAGDTSFYFYSAPTSASHQPVRIWAMGDIGKGTLKQYATRDAYYNYSSNKYTDLMLWLGDIGYWVGSDEDYTVNIFRNQYTDILKKTVLYTAAGNHDEYSAYTNLQAGPYFDIFNLPSNGEAGGVPSGTESYYSFNYSNIHFVCLESNIDSLGLSNAAVMESWLQADLAANSLPWKIAFFHHPPYSKGFHDSDVENQLIYMREHINPILEAYNVDLVLTGHSHDYERTYLIKGHFGNSQSFDSTMVMSSLSGTPPFVYSKTSVSDSGTVYAVVGSTSSLQTINSGWPHPAMYVAYDSTYGTLVIDVNGDTMHCRMLTDSMNIADYFAIVKNVTTGISNLPAPSNYYLYPQPVNSVLTISGGEGKKEVRVVNNLGETVLSKSFDQQSLLQIDVRNLSAGIYFVKIKDDNGTFSGKFVKINPK